MSARGVTIVMSLGFAVAFLLAGCGQQVQGNATGEPSSTSQSSTTSATTSNGTGGCDSSSSTGTAPTQPSDSDTYQVTCIKRVDNNTPCTSVINADQAVAVTGAPLVSKTEQGGVCTYILGDQTNPKVVTLQFAVESAV